jgi:hypothetical protein
MSESKYEHTLRTGRADTRDASDSRFSLVLCCAASSVKRIKPLYTMSWFEHTRPPGNGDLGPVDEGRGV